MTAVAAAPNARADQQKFFGTTLKRPMLAGKVRRDQLASLEYPLIVQPKIDGIRCLMREGVALSRKLEPIPNAYVQMVASEFAYELHGFDGELLVGDPGDPEAYRKTMSGVMSRDGTPDFTYHVFDMWSALPDATFITRAALTAAAAPLYHSIPHVSLVRNAVAIDPDTVLQHYAEYMQQGYEGVILRSKSGVYKQNRSTFREGYLLKLKEFEDAEAVVIGYEERMHNANEATTDALGLTKRSSAKAGKVGTNSLGALICKMRNEDVEAYMEQPEFKIGSGFTEEQRVQLWAERDSLPGRMAKFRYFGGGGYEKPRFPTFIGWRHELDI